MVCLATGPSLTLEDVTACRGHARVIAVNDACKFAPWADVLYACDPVWWLKHWHELRAVTSEKWSMAHNQWTDAYRARFADVQFLGMGELTGLSDDPTKISHGRNSGHQAVSLAVAFGARRILLLGYDMEATKGQAAHFFGDHQGGSLSPYPAFREAFAPLAAAARSRGIAILNCSRRTALTCVRRAPLAEALEGAV